MIESLLGAIKVVEVAKGSWEALAYPYSGPLDAASVVTVGNYIYSFGGYVSSNLINELWRYDTIDETWLKLANGLGACRNTTVAAVNNKIYYFAGVVNSSYVRTVRCYDIATNTWSTKPTVYPEQYVTDAATAVIDNKILIYGGKPTGYSLASTWLYDPIADSYTYQATRSPGIANDASFTLDGVNIISAMGTDASNASTALVKVYNSSTKIWSAGDPASTGVVMQGCKAGVINGKAYIFGGYSYTLNMYCYDGVKFKWSKVSQLGTIPAGRINHGFVVVGESCYMLGGRGNGNYAEFWKFTPTP